MFVIPLAQCGSEGGTIDFEALMLAFKSYLLYVVNTFLLLK